MGIRVDGKKIADEILASLREHIVKNHLHPHLEVILIGDNPSSISFIKQKQKAAESIGATVTVNQLPQTVTKEEFSALLFSLNAKPSVSGIIIQRPLPPQTHIPQSVLYSIDPVKDVDGFVPKSAHEVPVAKGIITILEKIFYQQFTNHSFSFVTWIRDQRVVVIGKGETAGKPITRTLERLNVPVVVIDRSTNNPHDLTKKATIIISCAGSPGIITHSSIREQVILLAVGIRKEEGNWVGDYWEDEIKEKASFYTPTPGGVGPVNVACLMQNLVRASES